MSRYWHGPWGPVAEVGTEEYHGPFGPQIQDSPAGITRDPASVDLTLSLTAPSRVDNALKTPGAFDLSLSLTAPVSDLSGVTIKPPTVDLVLSFSAPDMVRTGLPVGGLQSTVNVYPVLSSAVNLNENIAPIVAVD